MGNSRANDNDNESDMWKRRNWEIFKLFRDIFSVVNFIVISFRGCSARVKSVSSLLPLPATTMHATQTQHGMVHQTQKICLLQYSEKSQNLFVVPLSTNLLYGERGGLYSPFDGLLLYLLINKISEELRCDQRTRHFSILICIIFLFNFFSSLLLFLYFINIITTWKINFINIIIEAEICIIIIKRRKEEMMEIKKEKNK